MFTSYERSRKWAITIGSASLALIVGLALIGRLATPQSPDHQDESTTPKSPGQKGSVPGQVPAQHQQAIESPVSPAKSAKPATTLSYANGTEWWQAGSGKPFPAAIVYHDPSGTIGILNTSGPIDTNGHAFFTPLGTNGRACVTCHQPSDGMSVSLDTIRERWHATKGEDPLFDPVDGSNCPSLPQTAESSHSLLLNRGLFRIFLPWPPKAADGTPIKPEFSIEVVRDPTGCNNDPKYGLHSSNPMVSVYRRPRVVANMKYVTNGSGLFSPKQLAMPMGVDPETGKPVGMNMMADARDLTLKGQATDAVLNHEQARKAPTKEQLQQIQDFEMQIFSAQNLDSAAGTLVAPGGPTELGPESLAREKPGILGDNLGTPVFGNFDMWAMAPSSESPEQQAARESIARGFDVFFKRPFWIRDSVHINTIGLGNPVKRTCATCHNARMTGQDLVSGWVDLGTTNLPWSGDQPDLPLFKITCDATAPAHAFLGRVIYTHDPGRALISGKCFDVGTIVMQQFRGLAARAPYFSNGSAQSLRELVDFYDRRYNIAFTDQEKQDLINFLKTL